MEFSVYLQREREGRRTEVLLFLLQFSKMDIKTITEAVAPVLESLGLFLVDLKISRDNDITITVESTESIVKLDDCEVINRFFTETFSQDEEDYSLTVTSAGLDGEFKVQAQFTKAVGQKVEAWLKGGKKVVGVLESADEQAICIDGTSYGRNEVNKVKYYIEF